MRTSSAHKTALARRQGQARPAAPGNPAGFTLVELMVVLFILGILITLAVTAGSFIRDQVATNQTKTSMGTIMAAIEAYYEADKALPYDAANATMQIDNNHYPQYPNRDANSIHSSTLILAAYLYGYNINISATWLTTPTVSPPIDGTRLQSAPVLAAKPRLDTLSKDSLNLTTTGQLDLTYPNYPFRDGWGNGMRYYPDLGIGGKPVIISAGRYGSWSKNTSVAYWNMPWCYGYACLPSDADPDANARARRAYNIRSDQQ